MLMRRYYPVAQRNTIEPIAFIKNLEQTRKQLYHLFDNEAKPNNTVSTFPIELTETTAAYQLRALIPGVEREKIDVHATEDTLTLNVNWEQELLNNSLRPDEKPEKTTKEQTPTPIVHIREFKYGQMERTIQFAQPIANDQIDAQFKNGVLTLIIPKLNAQKKSPIKISVT